MSALLILLMTLFVSPLTSSLEQDATSPPPIADVIGERRVATHYFYWYRWPDEHMNPEGDPKREGHYHHFEKPESVSYLDASWHAQQFEDMASCGIDIALPVYWGAPGAYDSPGFRFSRAGLEPMVKALDTLRQRGEAAIKLGLFYDTTTLLNDVRGAQPRDGKADLTTPAGRKLFSDTVIEYFEQIPKRHWARFHGKVLVVTYVSAFAEDYDGELIPALRRSFADRFDGEQLYLVVDGSWGEVGQDATTAWGAALNGPVLLPGVAQIGPGYDDSPVPGRTTAKRHREDGAFYRYSWNLALESRPELVLIETWNEMHEGTEICPTRECGRLYLDITKDAVARFKQGLGAGPAVTLEHRHPQARPDESWGAEAARVEGVEASYGEPKPERHGLREVALEDGPIDLGGNALRPGTSWPGPVQYLYFQVSDHWRFDSRGDYVVKIDAPGARELTLEYDSWNEAATLNGSYTPVVGRRSADEPNHFEFELPAARFANRQNGGADFRIVVRNRGLELRSIEVTPTRMDWTWAGAEIMGHRSASRGQIIAALGFEIGEVYEADRAGWNRLARDLEKLFDFHHVKISAVRYVGFKAYLVVDIVERGDEARLQYRPQPSGERPLADREVLDIFAKLGERSHALFEAGRPSPENAKEGFLDYADPELHALVLDLSRLVPKHRQGLIDVIAHDRDSEKRATAATLLNWGGELEDTIRQVHGFANDLGPEVRNNLTRFMLHYLKRITKPALRSAIVTCLAEQLNRPSHGDRNKAAYALEFVVEAFPEHIPELDAKAGRLLRTIARDSVLFNVQKPCAEVVAQIEALQHEAADSPPPPSQL